VFLLVEKLRGEISYFKVKKMGNDMTEEWLKNNHLWAFEGSEVRMGVNLVNSVLFVEIVAIQIISHGILMLRD